jgi:hypothetical protein
MAARTARSRAGREDAAVVYPVVGNSGAYRVLVATDARGALVEWVGTRDNGPIVVTAVYVVVGKQHVTTGYCIDWLHVRVAPVGRTTAAGTRLIARIEV